MDIHKLSELRAERQVVQEAIITLERLSLGAVSGGADLLLGCPKSRDAGVRRAVRISKRRIERETVLIAANCSLITSFMIRQGMGVSRGGYRILRESSRGVMHRGSVNNRTVCGRTTLAAAKLD